MTVVPFKPRAPKSTLKHYVVPTVHGPFRATVNMSSDPDGHATIDLSTPDGVTYELSFNEVVELCSTLQDTANDSLPRTNPYHGVPLP